MSLIYWLIIGLAITILTLIIVELRIAKEKKVRSITFDSFTIFFCGMLEKFLMFSFLLLPFMFLPMYSKTLLLSK